MKRNKIDTSLEERLVNAMLAHKTPYEVSVDYGQDIDYCKALFPFGNYDSVSEAIRRMFIRGLSSVEIGFVVEMEPVLVRKILNVTFSEERAIVALLRMNDNGFRPQDISEVFGIGVPEVLELLEKFGRVGSTKKLIRDGKEKVRKLDPARWYEQLREELVAEVELKFEETVHKNMLEDAEARAEEIALLKTGVESLVVESDDDYKKRVLTFATKVLRLNAKEFTDYAVRLLGKSLGVVKSGKGKAAWNKDAVAQYKLHELNHLDMNAPHTDRSTKSMSDHMRGVR